MKKGIKMEQSLGYNQSSSRLSFLAIDKDFSKFVLQWKIETDIYNGDPLYCNGHLIFNSMCDIEAVGELLSVNISSAQKTVLLRATPTKIVPHCVYDDMIIASGFDYENQLCYLTGLQNGLGKWRINEVVGNFPIIHNNTFIATAYESISFVNPRNGDLLYKLKVGVPIGSACLDDTMIFFDSDWLGKYNNRLNSFDIAKKEFNWSRSLTPENHGRFRPRHLSPFPVIAERKIFLTLESGLFCLNFETGETLWTAECTPIQVVCIDRKVYCFDGLYFNCLDADTGKFIYRREYEKSGSTCSLPLVLGKAFFVSNKDHIQAFDITSGNRIWKFDFIQDEDEDEDDIFYIPQPLFAEGKLFAGGLGYMYCFGENDSDVFPIGLASRSNLD